MRSSKNQKSQSTLTGNEVSENIKEIMEEVLNVGLKEIKTRLLNIQSVNAAINERLTALENRLGGVRERLEVLEAKDDDVEKRLSFLEKRLDTERENPILHGENQLKERILSLELKLRSKNLIFGGVREIRRSDDCLFDIKTILREKFEMECVPEMESCYRIGKPSRNQERLILVTFKTKKERDAVWSFKNKLVGCKISLSEDFPLEIARRRKVLYPIMKKARELKKLARLRADVLIIDGKEYRIHNLNSLPECLKPSQVAIREFDDNILGFFSAQTPLSNFFPALIECDGDAFQTVEQYYQYQKAKFCEEHDVAAKIKQENDPGICKRLGDAIKIKPKDMEGWHSESKVLMKKACKAKFTQDMVSKTCLLNTRDKLLCECSFNRFWGTGLPLKDIKNGKKSEWVGKNALGEILMDIRTELVA